MSDRRLPPGGEASDPNAQDEERSLADTLRAPTLDEKARERLRSAVLRAWRTETQAPSRRSVRGLRWVAIAAAVGFLAAAVAWLVPRPAHETVVIGTLTRFNDGGILIKDTLVLRYRLVELSGLLIYPA